MSREKRLPGGLTAKERKFALNLCKGMRIPEAYTQAGFRLNEGNEGDPSPAYRKAKQSQIVSFMDEWLNQARISDLDSPGKAVNATLQAINEAKDDRNWTAIAALQRLRYQHNGIAEKTTINIEATISDVDLLRRIAGNDEGKLGSLQALLQPATFQGAERQPLLLEGQATEDEEP